MIFYFSGTGNSRHAAQRIAVATHSQLLSIDECLRRQRLHHVLSEGELLGFVIPTHFWGLPAIVQQFINVLHIDRSMPNQAPTYVFGVITYGSIAGAAPEQLRRSLASRGLKLTACFGVRMVDVWTPMFNLSHSDRNLRRTLKAEPYIDHAINCIKHRKHGIFSLLHLPVFLGNLLYNGYYNKRLTRHFHLMSQRCSACGLCARQCPMEAIELDERGKPFWRLQRCTLCLRCLHHCPNFAIQYGRNTLHHGQFTYPETLISD